MAVFFRWLLRLCHLPFGCASNLSEIFQSVANAERAKKKRTSHDLLFFNTAKTWGGGGEKWHFEIASALSDEGIPVI